MESHEFRTKFFLGFLLMVLIASALTMKTADAAGDQSGRAARLNLPIETLAEAPQTDGQRPALEQDIKRAETSGYVLQEVDGKVVCRDAAPDESGIVEQSDRTSLHV